MKKALLLTALLTSACSSERYEPEHRDSPAQADTVASEAAPGVNVTAAPGVAFNYEYAFRLPSARISAAQEAHATACEKLGIARCRITGMRYRLVGKSNIEAMLALRLDPTIAREFGKQATDIVNKSEGMLVEQEITGEDVGSKIKTAARSESQLREDLSKIESELRQMRASDPRRGELVARADELRRQIAAASQSQDSDKEALAGTPMVFNYGSGNVVPGFDVRSPIRGALQSGADSFVTAFSFILTLVAVLLPWLLFGGLLWWITARLRARFGWGVGTRAYHAEPDHGPRQSDRDPHPVLVRLASPLIDNGLASYTDPSRVALRVVGRVGFRGSSNI